MSKPLIYRQGRMFRINGELLSSKANNSQIKNALYMSLHSEFAGAINSEKYRHLTNEQKMQKMNEYAENWLKRNNLS